MSGMQQRAWITRGNSPLRGGTGQLELVNMAEGPVGRATFNPGWRWSEHVKPIAGLPTAVRRPTSGTTSRVG